MAKKTLLADAGDIMKDLRRANKAVARRWPGEPETRQPVHTVYGGAQLFKADTCARLGELALRNLETYAPDPESLARALELDGFTGKRKPTAAQQRLAGTVYERVVDKLRREPVEDFRIDFEDGFGNRPDDEEDETARTAARELAVGLAQGTVSPFVGIRIKSLAGELAERGVRTLDLFVRTLVETTGGTLPPNFVVTLPKITTPVQVEVLARLFDRLEQRLDIEEGALKMELMIELTQSIIDHQGRSNLPRLLRAARGRCTGAHFGTYDYTASCNITAAYQTMDHPACDFALELMKIAYASTGIHLSDGATNVMPVGPHRGELTEAQKRENADVVHNAWRLAYGHIRRSLKMAYYQGWDLHPAQLPIRYAAVYGFFLEGFDAAAERLRNFIEKAAQATLVGDVFDDAATGQGLLNYFLRALNCGAVSLDEVASTGLTIEEIRTRSFVKILDARRERLADSGS